MGNFYLHCSDFTRLAYSSCWNAKSDVCAKFLSSEEKLLRFTEILSEIQG